MTSASFAVNELNKAGIYRDETMTDKLMYIPNDDKQNSKLLLL